MSSIQLTLNDEEEKIIQEFKGLEELGSKEKAIKSLIKKSRILIPEIDKLIKEKEKYKNKGQNKK